MNTVGMSSTAILREANSLAASFQFALGFSAPEGNQFLKSSNPRAQFAWNMVRIAFERIAAIDLAEIAAEVDESPADTREDSDEP
jgi:hypothetical protein